MLRVLIVKISSMGDLIHTLPALTDAQKALGDISFDWVAAPEFSDIPSWHKTVNRVITCPLRQWKGRYVQALQHKEIQHFLRTLRNQKYDLVIDAQSALKSALIGKIAHGKNIGFDKNSVREWGAHFFYQKNYFVEKNQHATTRIRQLFSQALSYPIDIEKTPDYGIDLEKLPALLTFQLPKRSIVAIPNTTWPTKHWPDQYWQQLIHILDAARFSVAIPWGSLAEKQRAEALKKQSNNVIVLPKMSLSACARLLTQVHAAVSVDTGLGHLAAALQTPTVHLYGPTDPHKIGAYGKNQRQLKSSVRCAQACKRLCYSPTASSSTHAACLSHLTPDIVWDTLQNLL